MTSSRSFALPSIAVVALACGALAGVPPPSRTPARVVVSGRTSTLKSADDVKIVALGNDVPPTFSAPDVGNTPGFSWYVSQHYALKTDYKEEKARFYLRLLEMAYPHYVELFGAEPPGIHETRIAVVYASNEKQWNVAMESDSIDWRGGGGGVTILRNRVAYVYPSGTLDYHQRYILLHECTHAFQMCLTRTTYTTPGWFMEGIADSLGSHVYDSKRQQLTVNVLDKATTGNFLDQGLAALREKPLMPQEVHEKGGAGRGIGFLMIHFFNDDPDRQQKIRIWRDEMLRLAQHGETMKAAASRLLQELFGPWSQINADFRDWVRRLRSTFHYAEWGWEQDGDTLWAYGFATDGKLSQTDVSLIPKEKPVYDPLRMDYPAEEMSPLVGPVERGVAEPSVGALISFIRCPGRGRAGIGLGLVPDPKSKCNCLKLLIEKGQELTLDGTDLGAAKKVVPIPSALREAMKANGHRLGLTARIGEKALDVTLRAGDPANGPAELKASLPIDAPQRERLLSNPGTILARDGWHEVTPYFDDRRRPEPDLLVPAPPNRWRNPGDKPLAALYKACWRLGERAPASLRALRDRLLAAVEQDAETRRAACAAFETSIPNVARDIRGCGAPADLGLAAIADLLGLSLSLELAADSAPGHVRLTALLRGPLRGQVQGNIDFAADPADALAVRPAPEQIVLEAGQELLTRRVYRLASSRRPFTVRATAWLMWRGEEVVLQESASGRPSIGAWWVIGPFSNPGGDTKDIAHPPEKEPVDLKKEYPGAGNKPVGWRKVERDPSLDVAAEHLVSFIGLFGQT